MTLIATLFVVGVILLGFEVFIPGGILGVLAGLSMLAGTSLAFIDYGLGGGLMAASIAVVMVGGMLYFEFKILPQTTFGQRLFLKAAVDGVSSPERERDYVGAEGTTLTAMAPSGYIEIDGRRLEAFSRSGFLEAGQPVRVVGTDNFRLIVTSKPE
jgi:membrane-bound ClpP family serine protease